MNFAHGRMVTVRSTVTTEDKYGNGSTVVIDELWGPCAVAPRTSAENVDGNAPAVVIGLTVYGPSRALDSDDQLVIDGDVYAIEGHPGDWASPFTGWHPGLEVAVKRATEV